MLVDNAFRILNLRGNPIHAQAAIPVRDKHLPAHLEDMLFSLRAVAFFSF